MRELVEKFLAVRVERVDPLSLLGVAPEDCGPTRVIEALQDRLERVARHPHAETPEADDLRLALHAAAAQMLDPRVRALVVQRAMAERGVAGVTAPIAIPSATTHSFGDRIAAAPRPELALSPALQADAVLMLAMYGGWNRRSLRRLASLAHARGVPSDRVGEAIALVARSRQAPMGVRAVGTNAAARPIARPAVDRAQAAGTGVATGPTAIARSAAANGAASRVPEPEAAREAGDAPGRAMEEAWLDEPRRSSRTPLVVTLAVLVALFALAPIVGRLVRSSATQAVVSPKPTENAAPAPPAPRIAEVPTNDAAPVAVAPLARRIADAAGGLSTDPSGAVARFGELWAELGASWAGMPADERRAAMFEAVTFVFAATSARDVDALAPMLASLDALEGGASLAADRVGPAIAAAGLLVRLTGEGDLPARDRRRIESALLAALPGPGALRPPSFDLGAARAIERAGETLASSHPAASIEAWRAWISCVNARYGEDARGRGRAVVGALQALLIEGPEPNAERAALDAMGELTRSLRWTDAEGSRVWLVQWFRAPAVSEADLYAVTRPLVADVGAQGVDPTMVLAPGASELERRDLAERYARAWGLTRQASDQMRESMARSFDEIDRDARARFASPAAGALARGVAWSRFSEAAEARWRGESDVAAGILARWDDGIDAVSSSSAFERAEVLPETGGGDWALRYARAQRNIPVRVELLQEITRGTGRIGRVEAGFIVYEATRGTPAQVRAAAASAVERLSGEAAIIAAMLDETPIMPQTQTNADLVSYVAHESLPLSDAAWRTHAQRALGALLLEKLAGRGEFATVDDLAALFAESMSSRAGLVRGSGATAMPTGREDDDDDADAAEPPGVSPEQASSALLARWRRQASLPLATSASGETSEVVQRRLDALLRSASGPVQIVAARQRACMEFMGVVVASEQPERASRVWEIIGDAARAARTSESVFEQIAHYEKGTARLWLVRFREDEP
jgi:hypothetical protein